MADNATEGFCHPQNETHELEWIRKEAVAILKQTYQEKTNKSFSQREQ